jgi:hypothetical protein
MNLKEEVRAEAMKQTDGADLVALEHHLSPLGRIDPIWL